MQLWKEGAPLMPEDETFLINMKTSRTAVMTGRDAKLQGVVKQRKAKTKQKTVHERLQKEEDEILRQTTFLQSAHLKVL